MTKTAIALKHNLAALSIRIRSRLPNRRMNAAGNPLSDGATTFAWDAAGKLSTTGGCIDRHWVENAFARLKQYRAVVTRYDKLMRNYESMIARACMYLWLPM